MKFVTFTNLVTLLIFTVVPVLGILFWGWDWRQVVLLYWFGNITNGITFFISLAKAPVTTSPTILPAQNQGTTPQLTNGQMKNIGKYFQLIFLSFHYGVFTLVHGIFVFGLTSGTFLPLNEELAPINFVMIVLPWLIATVVQIVLVSIKPSAPYGDASHSIGRLYTRVIVLHVCIIAGGAIISYLQLPAITALLLIALHAIFELVAIKGQKLTATQAPTIIN